MNYNIEYILLSDNFTHWRDKINNMISAVGNFEGFPDMAGKNGYVLSNDGIQVEWIDLAGEIKPTIDRLEQEFTNSINEVKESIHNVQVEIDTSILKPSGVLNNSVLTYDGSKPVWKIFSTFFQQASSNYTISGTLTAKTFKGNLNGNATTSTSATKATQDANGNVIDTTYYKKTGGDITGDVNVIGNIDCTGDIIAENVYNAVWNDYAEFFPRGEETEPGDIIALDTDSDCELYVKASTKKCKVVGVHSDTFGHLIGGENVTDNQNFVEHNIKKYIPVGLAGRVRTKVIGEVKKGDYIVVSEMSGIGKVYDDSINRDRDIIGIACESCDKGIHRIIMKITC